jgi:hypothetical protein
MNNEGSCKVKVLAEVFSALFKLNRGAMISHLTTHTLLLFYFKFSPLINVFLHYFSVLFDRMHA